jgi:hypothetical protein
MHGESKELWVTVWASPPKINITVSLRPADTVGGE